MTGSEEGALNDLGDLNVENGGVGLGGDAAGAAIGADLSEETSGEAEIEALEEEGDEATKTADTGVAGETAADDEAMVPTEGGEAADESAAQPS